MPLRCPSCRFEAADGSRFCGRCGVAFGWRCETCRQDNPREFAFCSGCGRAVTGPKPTEERRHLTVLFADVVDSTKLALQLDDEEYRSLMLSVTEAVAAAVRAAGGHVSEILGDGVVAFFGVPDTHEDDAVRAVRAGLAAVAVGRGDSDPPGGPAVRLRVGIHSGTTVVGATQGAGGTVTLGALGVVPTLAARLQTAARPGQVLLSEGTWQLVEGYVDGERVGPFDLKGFPAAITAWNATGLSPAVDRVDARHRRTPFVGRVAELALLAAQSQRALAGGCRVVVVCGESGIGKSRLVRAFLDGPDATSFTRIVVRGQPDRLNTPLAPVMESIVRALPPAPGDAGGRAAQLDAFLASSGVRGEPAALIAALFNASDDDERLDDVVPETSWTRTIDGLCQWMWGLAAERPLLVQVEDAQWLDPSTLTLLTRLVDEATELPLLIIVTARPEFVPSWSPLGHVRTVSMNRLSAEESADLVAGQPDADPLAPHIIAAIAERSEGVPLYLEELAWLARTWPESALAGDVPDTLQLVLRAHLDRLGPERALAAVAAVLGRSVEPGLLAEVESVSEATVTHQLATLVQGDVLFRRPTPNGTTYVFRHMLLRDAAYGSLVRRRRLEVHRRVATVLAERFPDRAARHPEELAHHYAKAAMPAEAMRAWRRAGRLAGARNALTEAAGAYERALELVPSLPDDGRARRELGVLLELASVLHNRGGAGDDRFRAVADRAVTLARAVNNPQSLFLALTMSAAHHTAIPDRARAEPVLREMVAIADVSGEQRLAALSSLGSNAVLWGQRVEALELLDGCRSIHDPESAPNHYDHGLAALVWRAIVLRELGRLGEASAARREVEALLTRARPFNRCFAGLQLATMALLRDDVETADAHLEAASRLAGEHRFVTLELRISILQAAADAHFRVVAPDEMAGALEVDQRHGTMAATSPYRLLLVEAWARASEPDRAVQAADEALAFVAASGEAEYEGELHRARGEQLLALGDRDGATTALRTAVEVGARDGAVLFGAKAAAAWWRIDPEAAQPALLAAMGTLVLDVDEPDVVALRDIAGPVARAVTS